MKKRPQTDAAQGGEGMSDRKTELFLDKYRRLEALVRDSYNLSDSQSAVRYLADRKEFRDIRTELDYCREVRNLLSHNPKLNDRYAVEPSGELLTLLDRTIRRVQDPPRAGSVCVRRDRILCRTMEDLILPAMREMSAHVYSRIPILKNGAVCGIFSENTLLNWLIDQETVRIGADARFSDIAAYLPLSANRSESYRFVAKDLPAAEVAALFERALDRSDRIGMVFVTEHGRETEKLLGILTAWDVVGF